MKHLIKIASKLGMRRNLLAICFIVNLKNYICNYMVVCIFLAFYLQKLCILFKFREFAKIFISIKIGRLVFFMHSVLAFFNLLPYDKNCENLSATNAFVALTPLVLNEKSPIKSAILVRHKEFESLTFGSVDQRSIQLS